MSAQDGSTESAAPVTLVTTNTGRILRVTAAEIAAGEIANPPVVTPTMIDPARRADVLFRKRRDEGHEISVWWMIGAFVVTTVGVIALFSGVPGVA